MAGVNGANWKESENLGADIMCYRDDILQQALHLPPEDRAYIADVLEQSLSTAGFGTPELAEYWGRELERRITSHDRGESPARGDGEAVDRLRKRLADIRARMAVS